MNILKEVKIDAEEKQFVYTRKNPIQKQEDISKTPAPNINHEMYIESVKQNRY